MAAAAVLSITLGAATVAVVGSAGPSAASTPPSCLILSGSISTAVVRECSGGLGVGQIKAIFDSSGTVTWHKTVVVHGKSVVHLQGKTTVGNVGLTMGSPSRCAKGSYGYDLSGTVSADTTHRISVGSKVSAEVCFDEGGVSLAKGTVIKL